MAEPVWEMTVADSNIRVTFLKKDRAGIVEKVLTVEVRHLEEEGPNAGLA
jgi:hypothetical protein